MGHKKLHVGMSLAPTWLNGDAWRRQDSDVEGIFASDYYVDVAKRAEAAKCDFVFRPDTLYLNTQMLDKGAGFASLDPTILMAAIARETSHIGLLSTISTMFFPPFIVARQLQSLNWLSNGRVGWNIVTALDGNENFGLEDMPSSDARYAKAQEFTEIVKALWASFPNEALRLDKASGMFGDPAKVHPINFAGEYFSVKGPLNMPDFPHTRIPLIQAGASPVGRNFASSIADAIFASTPDMQTAIDLRADLRKRAEGHGRQADDIRVLPGMNLYLADTVAEARELFLETHASADRSRKIANIAQMTGLDLTDWSDNQVIRASDVPPAPEKVRSRTHSDLLRNMIMREEPSVADLLMRPEVIGSAHWLVVGTVGNAMDEIRTWFEAEAIDGFINVPGGSVASMHLSLEHLLPALAEEGLFRTQYSGRYFLDHLTEGSTDQ